MKKLMLLICCLTFCACAPKPSQVNSTDNQSSISLLDKNAKNLRVCDGKTQQLYACKSSFEYLSLLSPDIPHQKWALLFDVVHSSTNVYPIMCSYLFLGNISKTQLNLEITEYMQPTGYSPKLITVYDNTFGVFYYTPTAVPGLEDPKVTTQFKVTLYQSDLKNYNELYIACEQLMGDKKNG